MTLRGLTLQAVPRELMRTMFTSTLDPISGKNGVDIARMKESIRELGALLLTIEANGDYEGAGKLIAEKAGVPPTSARRLRSSKVLRPT